jgi:hypothetical protein
MEEGEDGAAPSPLPCFFFPCLPPDLTGVTVAAAAA